ncbi:hypothetical protein L208DRAFT_1316099, partial [Tricholoma matsutake]
TQVPILPAFTMTAHRAQGQTLNNVIINLQSCRGTEAPYVMASRACSLDGLLILRPFDRKKICCRESEDTCQEGWQLKMLNLLMLLKASEALREFHGDQSEITQMIPKDIGTMLSSIDPETALQTWQHIFEEHTAVVDASCMVLGPKCTLQDEIEGEDGVESTKKDGVTTTVNMDGATTTKSTSTSSIGRKRMSPGQMESIPNSKRQRCHK